LTGYRCSILSRLQSDETIGLTKIDAPCQVTPLDRSQPWWAANAGWIVSHDAIRKTGMYRLTLNRPVPQSIIDLEAFDKMEHALANWRLVYPELHRQVDEHDDLGLLLYKKPLDCPCAPGGPLVTRTGSLVHPLPEPLIFLIQSYVGIDWDVWIQQVGLLDDG